MSKLNKQIEKLNRKMEKAELLTFMGYLQEKTIRVWFETEKGMFVENFKFTNRNDYLKFNQHLRRITQ